MKGADSNKATNNSTHSNSFFQAKKEQGFFDQNQQSFFGPSLIQPKLNIHPADDAYEREADHAADQVLNNKSVKNITSLGGAVNSTQRKPAFESPSDLESQSAATPLMRKAETDPKPEESASAHMESQLNQSKGGGAPMDEDTQTSMESAFGRDFSGVRVHTDANAVQMNRDIGAQAFTHGNDIYFNQSKYNPNSQSGKHLLAHELTHTVQQGGIQKKSIQKAGGTNTGAGSTAALVSKDTFHGKKGTISKVSNSITLPALRIPAFKKSFGPSSNLTIRKGREEGEKRKTKQRDIWDKAAKGGAGLESKLKKKLAKAGKFGNPAKPIYYMRIGQKAGKKTNYLIGTETDILARLYRPYWTKRAKIMPFEVDHKLEYQLGGADVLSNLWLLERTANGSSGNNIKLEIKKQVDALRAESSGTEVWGGKAAPEYKELKRKFSITFTKVKPNLKVATASKRDQYPYSYSLDDIIKHAKPLSRVFGLTMKEVQKEGLQGSDTQLIIYNNSTGGRRFAIDLPNGQTGKVPFTDKRFLPGFQPTHALVNPESETIAMLQGQLFSTNPSLYGHGMKVEFPIKAFSGIPHTGRLNVSQTRRKLLELFGAGNVEMFGLSPLRLTTLTLDENKGILIEGKVVTDHPIIKGADIDFSITGDDLTLKKTFSIDEIKVPGPIKINECDLTISVSTRRGFGAKGKVKFEIPKVAKGSIKAERKGKNNPDGGLALSGDLAFDSKLFKPARIEASYINKKLSIGGELGIRKGKVKALESGKLMVEYNEGGELKASGEAVLKIPGIEEIKAHASYDQKTGAFVIGGSFKLKSGLPGLKSGGGEFTVIKDEKGNLSINASGKASASIAGMNQDLSITYMNGALTIEANSDYSFKKLKGKIHLGVTNRELDAEGNPIEGKASDTFKAYGSGSAELPLTKFAKGTIGIKVYPDGRITLAGGISLEKELPLLKKPYEIGPKSLGKLPSGDITIWGAKVFGKKLGIFLTYGGGVSFYLSAGPPALKSAYLSLEEIDPRDLSNMKLKGGAELNMPAMAYLQAELQLGLEGNLVILSVGGKLIPFARLQVEGNIGGAIDLSWSESTGLEFDNITGKLAGKAKVIFGLDAEVYAKLDLWIKTVTVYRDRFNLAKKELNLPFNLGVNFPIEMKNGQFKGFNLSEATIDDPISGKKPTELLETGYEEAKNPTEPAPSKEEALARVRQLGTGPGIYIKTKWKALNDILKNLNRESYYLWLINTHKDMEWGFIRAELNRLDRLDFEALKQKLPSYGDPDFFISVKKQKLILIDDFKDDHPRFPRSQINALAREVRNSK